MFEERKLLFQPSAFIESLVYVNEWWSQINGFQIEQKSNKISNKRGMQNFIK